MPRKTPMTAQQIVDKCNDLAGKFYAGHGYRVKKGYRFDDASHPQELGMWRLARMAFLELLDTDPEDALSELEPPTDDR